MKLLRLVILTAISCASFIECAKSNKPAEKPEPATHYNSSDQDEEVVLSAFASMLDSFGKIAGADHNPAIVAPNVTNMLAQFAKVLIQVFRTTPLRNNKIMMSHIEDYFENMSKEEHTKIVSMIVSKAYEFSQLKASNPEKLQE
jgi:hypothetical protein